MGRSDRSADKIKVGVSSCLLGEKVRYNGEHTKNDFVAEVLGRYFEWVPVCPEVEAGMGIPRETVYLEGAPDAPRMIGDKTKKDWTRPMRALSEKRGLELERIGIAGYIFKKNSPSCGVFRVKVYTDKGMPSRGGRGLFAAAFAGFIRYDVR